MLKEIYLNDDFVNDNLPKRDDNSHKGTYGKFLNIAGSIKYQGAAYLSSVSALRSGCGYVTLATPDFVMNNIASVSPDITFLPLKSKNGETISSENAKSILQVISDYSAVSVGSGLGLNRDTINFIKIISKEIENIEIPVIFDADALNCISNIKDFKYPKNSVITPHPKEFARLLNISVQDLLKDKQKYIVEYSEKNNITVVLKMPVTMIYNENIMYINNYPNSTLSKAGVGDVLTGIISGFAAQGLALLKASALGVYIHSQAALEYKKEYSSNSLVASDLSNYIPKILKKYEKCE